MDGGERRVYPTAQNFAQMVEAYLGDNMGIKHVPGGVLERYVPSVNDIFYVAIFVASMLPLVNLCYVPFGDIYGY